MKYGFIKVAAATNEIKVADCIFNREKIIEMALGADEKKGWPIGFPWA